MTGLGAPCTLPPPTLTPVDRNKAYCFHELVLNLPLRWTSNDQNAFSFRWGASPPLPPDQGLCPQTPVIGSCSALAMVPPQPLTPSAAYGHNSQPWALQTVEPIEVLFGVWSRVGPRNPYVGPDPQGKRHLGGPLKAHCNSIGKIRRAVGQYSQPYSVGGSSNAAFRCHYWSSLFLCKL